MEKLQGPLAASSRDSECQWRALARDSWFLKEAMFQQLWLVNMAC
jgi:hypothetical protein